MERFQNDDFLGDEFSQLLKQSAVAEKQVGVVIEQASAFRQLYELEKERALRLENEKEELGKKLKNSEAFIRALQTQMDGIQNEVKVLREAASK